MKRSLIFKSMYWSYEDLIDENKLIIHVSGMTRDQETVQIQIENFTPYVYLELPKRLRWNKVMCTKLFEYFKGCMKKNGPLIFKFQQKNMLYFEEKILCMFLTFPTSKACMEFNKKCSFKNFIPGVGMIYQDELLVHEHNIDPILKLASIKNILLSSWISVTESIHEDELSLSEEQRKFSTADIDMYVDYKKVEAHEMKETIILNPKYCSFDIECYSQNHNSKLPDPKEPENVVFQISMVFGKIGDSSYHKSYLLSLFDPLEIEDSTLLKFKYEKELLLKFSKLIRKKDPLIFEGYNIMKFDWTYMIARAEKLGILPEFLNISRIIGKKAKVCTVKWNSSAYKDQEFSFPDCFGRIQLDVILEIERNFRLPTYSLNAVAEKFLNEKKDDITPRQLFMFYKITDETLHLLHDTISDEEFKNIQRQIKTILPLRKTHGVVRRHRKKMLECTNQYVLKKLVRECLTMTLKYCKQDTILPIKLIDKLNLLTTMEEMSNVMHVPMSYLHTRGQQIKVLAQVYREALQEGLIIPYNKKDPQKKKEHYEGAIVAEAHAGDYDNVGTLDFTSLYPSTIMAFNICYKTLVKDNSVPNSECHVLEWTSHIGCPHDPQKRKKKIGNQLVVICGDFKCRFKKVKITYDEKTKIITRENEGVLPRLERNLLTSRKEVKKEMFKAEARLKMNRGEATEEEIIFYRKCNFEIIEKDSLSYEEDKILETLVGVLNAKQLAIKVSANSVPGKTPVLCLVNGIVQYKNIEDLFVEKEFQDEKDNELYTNQDNKIKVWSDGEWGSVKAVIRHHVSPNDILYKINTQSGSVVTTKHHSLLDLDGSSVETENTKIGDCLLHADLPIPKDTPASPKYKFLSKNIVDSHIFCSDEEENFFLMGLYFNEESYIEYLDTQKPMLILQKRWNGDVKNFIKFYGHLFRNDKNYRIVPHCVYSGGYSSRLAFLLGVYCSNSFGSTFIKNKGNISSAGLFLLLEGLGYSVKIQNIKEDEYILSFGHNYKNVSYITEKIPIQNESEYVYDIETSTHHFGAGVGDMIVHNSAYGAMGADQGFIPLISGAASVTAMGRKLITMATGKIKDTWKN